VSWRRDSMRPWRVQDHSSSADLRHLVLRQMLCYAMLCYSLTREAIPEGLSAAQCRVDTQLSQARGQLVPFCSAQRHVKCGERKLERLPAVNVPELRGLASVAPSVLGLCARSRSSLLSAPATLPPAQAKASRPSTRTAAGNTIIAPSSLFDQPSVC
jgi:hypothetical protein